MIFKKQTNGQTNERTNKQLLLTNKNGFSPGRQHNQQQNESEGNRTLRLARKRRAERQFHDLRVFKACFVNAEFIEVLVGMFQVERPLRGVSGKKKRNIHRDPPYSPFCRSKSTLCVFQFHLSCPFLILTHPFSTIIVTRKRSIRTSLALTTRASLSSSSLDSSVTFSPSQMLTLPMVRKWGVL